MGVPLRTESRSCMIWAGSVSGPCRKRLWQEEGGRMALKELFEAWIRQEPGTSRAAGPRAPVPVQVACSPVVANHLLFAVPCHLIEALAGVHLREEQWAGTAPGKVEIAGGNAGGRGGGSAGGRILHAPKIAAAHNPQLLSDKERWREPSCSRRLKD